MRSEPAASARSGRARCGRHQPGRVRGGRTERTAPRRRGSSQHHRASVTWSTGAHRIGLTPGIAQYRTHTESYPARRQPMKAAWTRREFLTRAGVAVAAVQTFEHLDPCCALAADAPTARQELFELKPVADGVYAAIA